MLTCPHWQVKQNGEDRCIDCSDEYESNWMSFIRPATCYTEQNLIAFQLNSREIYFATIKNIAPRTELRVWYAKAYAEIIGERILEITPEEAAGNPLTLTDTCITVEPLYNEVHAVPLTIILLYQGSHYIREKNKEIKLVLDLLGHYPKYF